MTILPVAFASTVERKTRGYQSRCCSMTNRTPFFQKKKKECLLCCNVTVFCNFTVLFSGCCVTTANAVWNNIKEYKKL